MYDYVIMYLFEDDPVNKWNLLKWKPKPDMLNTLRPRQNGRHFADDIFKRIFMNENVRICINIFIEVCS